MTSSALGFEVGKAYARLSIKKMELTLLHMLSQGTSLAAAHCRVQGTRAHRLGHSLQLLTAGCKGHRHRPGHSLQLGYSSISLFLMSKSLQLKCVKKSLGSN